MQNRDLSCFSKEILSEDIMVIRSDFIWTTKAYLDLADMSSKLILNSIILDYLSLLLSNKLASKQPTKNTKNNTSLFPYLKKFDQRFRFSFW